MNSYSLSHLSDGALLRDLSALVSQDRSTTAALLAHLAEVDGRKLYLPAAFPSMFAYCVGELRFSEETAYKRIQAARAARWFPAIFDAVADGRLHLSAVVLLKPHLTPQTADELLAAAAHKSKSEIELLLAHRFPKPDVKTRIAAIPLASPAPVAGQLDPDPVQPRNCISAELELDPDPVPTSATSLAPEPVKPSTPVVLKSIQSQARVVPLSPRRFALHVTIDQSTLDKLHRAEQLLAHQVRSGDVAEVLDRALNLLLHKLEKTKFAVTEKPRPQRSRPSANERYIPAHVKRAVRERDGDQCTYVSETGRRCKERSCLEFDHVLEVARGGQATVDGIRLRCRPHNQFTAEQTFGIEFMKHKRELAQTASG